MAQPQRGMPLSSASCDAMLNDPKHLFASMWGATPWVVFNQSKCWEVSREDPGTQGWNPPQVSTMLFKSAVRTGRHCKDNWLLGNAPRAGIQLPSAIDHLRGIGRPNFMPAFTAEAPALLGFDWQVHQHCSGVLKAGTIPFADFEHAAACVAANRNILWLKEDGNHKVNYNLCRNLEWLTCAARGELHGQSRPSEPGRIVFANPPSMIEPDGRPPLDGCRKVAAGVTGVAGGRCPEGASSYTSSDVYFLEVCLLAAICLNGAELFEHHAAAAGLPVESQQRHRNSTFQCEYSDAKVGDLLEMLTHASRRRAMRSSLRR